MSPMKKTKTKKKPDAWTKKIAKLKADVAGMSKKNIIDYYVTAMMNWDVALDQRDELKAELAEAREEEFQLLLSKAFGEHLEPNLSVDWRVRVGSYPKATDEDLLVFHAVMGQPKFGITSVYKDSSFYHLAMGVMHRLLDAETSHDVLRGCHTLD